MQPLQSIVPIVQLDANDNVIALDGTGFFVIAVVPKAQIPGIEALKLTPQLLPLTDDVVALEYSSTRFERRDGAIHVHFEPMSHKGNLMRSYVSDFPGWKPTRVWDTSFPALQGASGAPVVALRGMGVVGMLIANRERHLIPAQIARIESGGGLVEETRYFLPTGIAMRSVEIAVFLLTPGIDAEAVMHRDLAPDV